MTQFIALTILALLVITGACMAALVRHVLYCIVGLGISLLGLAGLFLFLGSPFVATMQILIYIGGISVAMVFAMMLSVSMARRVELGRQKFLLSLLAAISFFVMMASLIIRTPFQPAPATSPEQWAPAALGRHFLEDYNLVFEGLSLVLLLAIIGAVLIAKREEYDA